MAQDHGLCREKDKMSANGPVHGPPLQARVAAANGTVLAACKLLALSDNKLPALTDDDPGAHGNEQGASKEAKWNDGGKAKLNGGKMLMGSGHGRQRWQANKQPAEQGTAGRHSRQTLRPAQASKQTATDGRPRSENNSCRSRWPASRRAVQVSGGECSGTGSHEGGCRPTYTVPTPPIAFACHCPYPLP